ncbi:MAG: hypothetical protein AAB416_00765 [Patescibacteria group bacterium]
MILLFSRVRWCAQMIGVIGVLLGFFVLYSYLPSAMLEGSIVRLNSPDETANYFFTKLFSEKGELTYRDDALLVSKNYVHPRSMTVVVDVVAPVSFVGMPVLYGLLARVTGAIASVYFTPLLAVIAIPFYCLLIARIFSPPVGVLSGLLLLVHPAYWYYASRSMMPNVLFVALCMIGFSLLLWKKRFAAGFFGGLFIGAGLLVRFSEAPWVFGILGLLFLFYLLRHRPLHVMGCVLGLAVPLYAFFWFNNAVYGSPLLFGYQTIDTSSAVRALEQSQSVFSSFTLSRVGEVFAHAETILVSFLPYLLPFGFVPHIFWENFLNYFLFMFWWLVLPTGVGICYSLRLGILRVVREKTIDFRLPYIVVTALVSAWLIIFYGSWLFVDNITEEATIGNSYVRYWLPLTILTIPFAAQTVIFVRDRLSGIVRSAVFPLVIAAVVFYGFEATLWGSRESLETAARVLSDYREKALVIERLTPSNAIIFSQRSDKIFFPERRAAQATRDFHEVPLLPELVASYPVYYYGLWNEDDARHLTTKYFKNVGLKLNYVASLDSSERLYSVTKNGQ